MKRLFLSIIAIFICLNSFSQFVITGTKQGVNYIKPCIENFAYMSTLDYTTFSRYMEQYHYSEGESNAQWYSYTASLDNFLVHAVTNFNYAYGGRSIICWIPKSEMYPKLQCKIFIRNSDHIFFEMKMVVNCLRSIMMEKHLVVLS